MFFHFTKLRKIFVKFDSKRALQVAPSMTPNVRAFATMGNLMILRSDEGRLDRRRAAPRPGRSADLVPLGQKPGLLLDVAAALIVERAVARAWRASGSN